MTVIPVMIPVTSEPKRCPACKRVESKVEVCEHCRHEYKSELKYTTGEKWFMAWFAATAMWIVLTLVWWLLDFDNPTLVEVVKNQIEWVTSLRIW